jgi:hypothetical protein
MEGQTPGYFTRIAKYSRASRIFYGRFLRPEDFLLQNCATQRNAARMLNCRITQHPQRCATLRKRAQKLCLRNSNCRFHAVDFAAPKRIALKSHIRLSGIPALLSCLLRQRGVNGLGCCSRSEQPRLAINYEFLRQPGLFPFLSPEHHNYPNYYYHRNPRSPYDPDRSPVWYVQKLCHHYCEPANHPPRFALSVHGVRRVGRFNALALLKSREAPLAFC